MELTLTIQAARPAAAIGNGRATALLAEDGSIAWLALPRTGDPTVFDAAASPLAAFTLAPEGGTVVRRGYVGDTPVLETEWRTPTGRAQVVEFLPVRLGAHGDAAAPRWPHDRLVRIVEVLEGEVTLHYRLSPRPGGRGVELVEDPNGLILAGPESALVLQTRGDVTLRADGSVDGVVALAKGQRHGFMLTFHPTPDPDVKEALETEPDWDLDGTYEFWLSWGRVAPFQGVQRGHVMRLLALLRAWMPPPGAGAMPPFFAAPFAAIAPVVLAAWGHEAELPAAAEAWPPPPAQAGWLLDALAAGNATGLVDPFAWLPAWPRLAAAADALAASPGGTVGLDLAIAAGLRGAAALAEDLLQPGDLAAWREAADRATRRVTGAAEPAPEGWDVALGLAPGAQAGAGVDAPPAAPEAAYWAIRRELAGGAYLQARRLLDAFIRDHVPARPASPPDFGALCGLLWLAALVYLQGPPTPGRVQLPGDLGD